MQKKNVSQKLVVGQPGCALVRNGLFDRVPATGNMKPERGPSKSLRRQSVKPSGRH